MRKGPVLTAAVVLGALLTPGAALAQQECGYALQMHKVVIASSQGTPPSGYAFAEQPADAQPPGSLHGLPGRLTSSGGCAVGSVGVSLTAREAGQTTFRGVRSTTTNGAGEFTFDPAPSRTTVVRASASLPGDGTVLSGPLTLAVRVAVSATYERAGGCVLRATGSTFPAKPGHPVYVQVPVGSGYSTVARTTADASGRYAVAWQAGCGNHDLVVTIPASASNTAGRTRYVRQDVTAR